eukprot:scaffold98471_cov36-Phaeocystis_antarctica.AAC.1
MSGLHSFRTIVASEWLLSGAITYEVRLGLLLTLSLTLTLSLSLTLALTLTRSASVCCGRPSP